VRRTLRFIWVLVVDPFLFAAGVVMQIFTKRTPLAATGSLRRLYVATDGRINDTGAKVSGALHPARPLERVHGVLGDLDAAAVNVIAGDIQRNGYHIFETKLDEEVCDRIVEFARHVPATLIPPPAGGPTESVYDPASPLGPRYDLAEQRIFELPELQELATDQTLMAVAQAYLKCRPINDLVAMWWSAAVASAPSSEAAQLFHFDMDRLKFIKFFLYLTDVDERHGPHVYVAASHVRKPKAVRRDGRIPDDEIVRQYGNDAIVEITGERGTLLAVDTRGFHKGKALEVGDRLLFQVEYANSLFGAPYNRIEVGRGWSERALQQLGRYPAVFERFDVPSGPAAA
jgi:Phytanoyl-CoA dioxygenase (PhyH)